MTNSRGSNLRSRPTQRFQRFLSNLPIEEEEAEFRANMILMARANSGHTTSGWILDQAEEIQSNFDGHGSDQFWKAGQYHFAFDSNAGTLYRSVDQTATWAICHQFDMSGDVITAFAIQSLQAGADGTLWFMRVTEDFGSFPNTTLEIELLTSSNNGESFELLRTLPFVGIGDIGNPANAILCCDPQDANRVAIFQTDWLAAPFDPSELAGHPRLYLSNDRFSTYSDGLIELPDGVDFWVTDGAFDCVKFVEGTLVIMGETRSKDAMVEVGAFSGGFAGDDDWDTDDFSPWPLSTDFSDPNTLFIHVFLTSNFVQISGTEPTLLEEIGSTHWFYFMGGPDTERPMYVRAFQGVADGTRYEVNNLDPVNPIFRYVTGQGQGEIIFTPDWGAPNKNNNTYLMAHVPTLPYISGAGADIYGGSNYFNKEHYPDDLISPIIFYNDLPEAVTMLGGYEGLIAATWEEVIHDPPQFGDHFQVGVGILFEFQTKGVAAASKGLKALVSDTPDDLASYALVTVNPARYRATNFTLGPLLVEHDNLLICCTTVNPANENGTAFPAGTNDRIDVHLSTDKGRTWVQATPVTDEESVQGAVAYDDFTRWLYAYDSFGEHVYSLTDPFANPGGTWEDQTQVAFDALLIDDFGPLLYGAWAKG